MKQLELSELDSLFRLSGLAGEEPLPSVGTGLLGTGLLTNFTGVDFPASNPVVEPGRFDELPPEGDGVGVELD